MTKEMYQNQAKDNFMNGLNCAQAVAAAYADICHMDRDTIISASSGFGGGFARMREVCGTVSGAVFVLNLTEWVRDENGNYPDKASHYRRVQAIMKKFQAENGSYICRELLGVGGAQPPVPEARTDAYYKKRPCPELVFSAAGIVWEQLHEDGIL